MGEREGGTIWYRVKGRKKKVYFFHLETCADSNERDENSGAASMLAADRAILCFPAGKHLMKKIQTISQYTQRASSSLRASSFTFRLFVSLSSFFFVAIYCIIFRLLLLQFVYPTRLLSPDVPVN
jgi:hypothetical protein